MKTVHKTQKNICNSDDFFCFQKYTHNKVQITADLPLISGCFQTAVYGEQSSNVHAKSTIQRCLK